MNKEKYTNFLNEISTCDISEKEYQKKLGLVLLIFVVLSILIIIL